MNYIFDNDKIYELYEFSINNFCDENGERFIGELKNGLKEGKGILYYDKNDKYKRHKYEGYFKKDQLDGKGIMIWNDMNVYKGDWKNGKKEGKGIMNYNDGDRYEGDFIKDEFEGKGKYYWNNGDLYIGEFKNGMSEGKGKYYYINGNIY